MLDVTDRGSWSRGKLFQRSHGLRITENDLLSALSRTVSCSIGHRSVSAGTYQDCGWSKRGRVPMIKCETSTSNSNLLKLQRAQRTSYKLLKHIARIKPTSVTRIHCSQNKKEKTLRPHKHYIKFTMQKLTK